LSFKIWLVFIYIFMCLRWVFIDLLCLIFFVLFEMDCDYVFVSVGFFIVVLWIVYINCGNWLWIWKEIYEYY